MPLTRTDFRHLADVRAAEAAVLLAAGRWDGAYYLAGSAVECGLKACIMKRVENTGIIFEDKKFAERCWTHNIEHLVDLADLTAARDTDTAADPLLQDNWDVVIMWNEASRYTRTVEADARKLVAAVADPTHGVLQWIRRHW